MNLDQCRHFPCNSEQSTLSEYEVYTLYFDWFPDLRCIHLLILTLYHLSPVAYQPTKLAPTKNNISPTIQYYLNKFIIEMKDFDAGSQKKSE